MKTYCCLNVHHVVFETTFNYLVMFITFISKTLPGIFAHTMESKYFKTGSILFAFRKNHPPFPNESLPSRQDPGEGFVFEA